MPVDHQIVGEHVQPGQEGLALPAKAFDGCPSLQEDLLGQILCVGAVANAVQDVAVHRAKKLVVQSRERGLIALLRALDKRNDGWFVADRGR